MSVTLEIKGIERVQKNLRGLGNEALQYSILQSIMRDAGKAITSKAASFAGSRIGGSSGLKAFLSNQKNIKYKPLRKEFRKKGIVTGTIAPRSKKNNKKYGRIMHLFSVGASRKNRGNIKATNFMRDAMQAGWPDFQKRFENRSFIILKRWAKRKGFKVT
jgi:hypothetical protein